LCVFFKGCLLNDDEKIFEAQRGAGDVKMGHGSIVVCFALLLLDADFFWIAGESSKAT